MIGSIVPDGYAAVRDLVVIVQRNARSPRPWGLRGDFDPARLDTSGSVIEQADGSKAVVTFGGDAPIFIEALGRKLASSSLSALAIVLGSGEIIPVTAADWRRLREQDSMLVSSVSIACDRSVIEVTRNDGTTVAAVPIIALHDLAVAFDATDPPVEPYDRHGSGAAADPTVSDASASSNAARMWMYGYAVGYLAGKSDKPKREPSIQACQQHISCTYRTAEDAWNALPADFKRPHRKAADVDKEQ